MGQPWPIQQSCAYSTFSPELTVKADTGEQLLKHMPNEKVTRKQ